MEDIACSLIALLWTGLCAVGGPAVSYDERELRASPGAVAIEQISNQGAEGIFELLPSRWGDRVKHVPSGLVCRIDFEAGGELRLGQPGKASSPAVCRQAFGPQRLTLTAKRIGGLEPGSALEQSARARARKDGGTPRSEERQVDGRTVRVTRWLSAEDRQGAVSGHMVASWRAGDWVILFAWDADLEGAAGAAEFRELGDTILAAVVMEMEAP